MPVKSFPDQNHHNIKNTEEDNKDLGVLHDEVNISIREARESIKSPSP
jgi:hypothetical protein